jgi:Membrane-bound metallopeptidase
MSIKEYIKDKVNIRQEDKRFKKGHLKVQDALKDNAGFDAQAAFNPTVLSWIFLAVTFFLQIISLATTYSGSKVYFGGIKLPLGISAPFLFAVSVQLIVFTLCNSLKRNMRAGTIAILLIATLCSTYFSYIGIYNYINSPIIYLEEKYNQVYHNMTDKYRAVVDDSKNQMKQYIFDITGKLLQENTRLAQEGESYNKLAEQVARVSVNTNVVSANTGNLAKPNINNYGSNLEQYYADMARYNNAIASIVGQAAAQNSSAQAAIYDSKIKTILGGKSLEEFNKELADLQSKRQLMDNMILSVYGDIPNKGAAEFDKRINEIQQYCISYVNSREGDREKFNTILTNMFTAYSNVTSTETSKDFNKALNSFFTVTDSNQTFMRSLRDVEKNVYLENHGKELTDTASLSISDSLLLFSKLQSEMKNGAYLLNSFSGDGQVIDLNSEEYALENMYVLPVKNLFTNSSVLRIAWFCLAFAALIDGLTLLFAMIGTRNKRILVARKNSHIVRKNEELTEELLLSSLMLHHVDDANKSTVQSCLEHLTGFLKPFRITPVAMEEGFSLFCPLSKLKEYHIFLSVLCQFNLAKIVSNEDFKLLGLTPTIEDFEYSVQGERPDEAINEAAATTFEDGEDSYVLLKTKFVIWVNQKLSAASSDRRFSAMVSDILRKIEEPDKLN